MRVITKPALFVMALFLLVGGWLTRPGTLHTATPAETVTRADSVERVFEEHRSGTWIEADGVVDALLRDDLEGSRHQKFVVRLAGGTTILVSHNIDLAPRVPLAVGDEISIRGEYVWNEKGGIVHWTHHDPEGRRDGGWIRHRDRDYR